MARNTYPSDAIEQARAVLEAWRNIDPALRIGDLELTALETGLAQAEPFYAQIDSLESELTDARNKRDAHIKTVWEMVKRVRMGMKAIYGDDSSQYEMVGGTRLSERKPVSRKQTVA